jgi:hypothetical protein
MKIPKVLSICGHDIKVVIKPGELKVDGSPVWGWYDDKNHTICLNKGMAKTRQMEVLLHEAIHAVSSIHCLALTEKQVKLLGIEILALIRNNKLDFLYAQRRPKPKAP